MKFQVVFKTPDALEESLVAEFDRDDCDSEEAEDALSDKINAARRFAAQYIRFGEYVILEFDTDAKTATVLKHNRA